MNIQAYMPGWEVVRPIGNGSFGQVYEIKKEGVVQDGKYRSALKVISVPHDPAQYKTYKDDGLDDKSITAIFEGQVNRILSECKLLSKFRGTGNIVSYEDHFCAAHSDGHGWDILIRMELLTALPDYISRVGISPEMAVKLGIDICQALELCAKINIVHRDIKPQNIFVNTFTGDYKLGDFGIAREMEHTTQGTRIGTCAYMAPEVFNGQPYGTASDVYSLGLVLYWILNERRLPFVEDENETQNYGEKNEQALIRRLGGERVPEPKNGSSALKAIILKACEPNPENRFVSAEELKIALERLPEASQAKTEKLPDNAAETALLPQNPQVVTEKRNAKKTIIVAGVISLILIAASLFAENRSHADLTNSNSEQGYMNGITENEKGDSFAAEKNEEEIEVHGDHYQDGIYSGDLDNNIPHGYGTLEYANGDVYAGQWVSGERSGEGTMTYSDGTVYTGEFTDDEATGYGTFTFANGNSYTGYVVRGAMEGYGTYTFASGDSFSGMSVNDCFEGNGVYRYADGRVYTGGFHNDQFSGKGVLTWPDGDKYDGEFANGLMNGHGIYTWANGDEYNGEVANDLKNGQGTYVWADGRIYTGSFFDDEKCGEGMLTWPNGEVYKGEFANDVINGDGIYTWPNGDEYKGSFKNDEMLHGTMVYADGTREII